jgi:Flp pilus assembly pilin Flp
MSLKAKAKAIWNDESAQGATEYILILVATVTIAFIFKDKLKEFVNSRLTALGTGLGDFNVERN